MKYVDEYPSSGIADKPAVKLRRSVTSGGLSWMSVVARLTVCCGTDWKQRWKIHWKLVHGPGCPVCVTPAEAIDDAVEIAKRPDVILASFGDMLRVPDARQSVAGQGFWSRRPDSLFAG